MSDSGRLKGGEVLLLALAGGMTLRAAAAQAGVNERTARRRMADPKFRDRLRRLQAEAVGQASARLTAVMDKAVGKLEALLDAKNEAIVLGAVKVTLEQSVRLREINELEQRLAALEQAQSQGGWHP